MDIVYIFDDNYAAISGVSILSLLEKNKKEKNICIYIIDGGISDENKSRLNAIATSFDRSLCYLTGENPEYVFGMSLNIRTWGYSNFYRLYLDRILPDNVEKALYIDSDTLIVDELSSLYNMDMSNYTIAATYDCAPTPKYDLGLEITDPYYSDGILLLNVKKIREQKIFERFKKCLTNFNGDISYLEQGVINYTLKDEICLLPARYNVMTLSLIFDKVPGIFFSKADPYYTLDEIMSAIAKPAIVHITGHPICIRPWYYDSNHPYFTNWNDELKKTAWKSNFQYGRLKLNDYDRAIKKIKFQNRLMKYKVCQIIYGICSKRMLGLVKYRVKKLLGR